MADAAHQGHCYRAGQQQQNDSGRESHCSNPRPLLPRRSAIFSISVNESFAQGFQGRFGRPREVFFFAMPSTQPEEATGRALVRSGDRLGLPPLETTFDTTEFRSAEQGVSALPCFDVLAAFRLLFR